MLQRCYWPKQVGYKYYGGRGVEVCDRWNPAKGGSFANFLADMGKAPDGLTLDKDIRGGIGCKLYSPENCMWATAQAQQCSKRSNRFVTIKGERKTLIEWSRSSGVHKDTLRDRVERNWPEDRLLEPVAKRNTVLRN
jgi:hypothetical protein